MIDHLENTDFLDCINTDLSKIHSTKQNLKWSLDPTSILRATAPMKVAISSANNSDRHGAAKLEGSRVLNMCVDLVWGSEEYPRPTIEATIQLVQESIPSITFNGYNDMSGKFEEHVFSFTEETMSLASLSSEDTEDPFRFYKYVLHFSGIVQDVQDTKQSWRELMEFTLGRGLLITLKNSGPSRSGFSSSSAVMTTLLSLLYKATNQVKELKHVYDLALLAENRLGLRSGWNDTYCLLPGGIHDFYTQPCPGIPTPKLTKTNFGTINLESRLWLVHTGVQRKATNRMNRRHEVYLSKDEALYPYIVESLALHEHMSCAMHQERYEALGKYMTRYMDCRIAFDPEATNPQLTFLFKEWIDKGLIYGGLLAGAMGGGIAQVIVSDYGLQVENGKTRMEAAIEDMKLACDSFNNKLYRRIKFGVNVEGVKINVQV
ncbi:bifunctional fucokinase/fucose pyrophosphorylase [Acrasis kona]|uniref:Bifunctional fucokinase/fucose pyrophosphorylase n=1 Tax=Acrasis kona TaxID=1008807 RepID=A0AAW2YW71_9EUKA